MYRTLALAAVLGALALPAAATTTVRVNVAGLDSRTAHATIVGAARAACQEELRGASTFEFYYAQPTCVRSAIARAEASAESAHASAAAARPVTGR